MEARQRRASRGTPSLLSSASDPDGFFLRYGLYALRALAKVASARGIAHSGNTKSDAAVAPHAEAESFDSVHLRESALKDNKFIKFGNA